MNPGEANEDVFVPMLDYEIAYLIIKDFQVEVPANEIDLVLGTINKDLKYWDSLTSIKSCLVSHKIFLIIYNFKDLIFIYWFSQF